MPRADGAAATSANARRLGDGEGLLKGETLRSVGHLLSGTVYHLVLALLTLSSIALLYMSLLFFGSPGVDAKLREVTAPLRRSSPAYSVETKGTVPPEYHGPAKWSR